MKQRKWNRALLALGVLSLGADCSEQGFSQLSRVDSFQQNLRSSVDLLVIVDNSCSMVEEQTNLAQNFGALISTFEEADVSWQIAVATTDVESPKFKGMLVAGEDEVVISGATGELDRVIYDRDWEFTEGKSRQLDPYKFSVTSNDSRDNWCEADQAYAEGSYGSPGSLNSTCSGEPGPEPEPGTDDGPRAPGLNDLLITEIMAEALGQDSLCEWVELTNTTDDTLDLSALVLSDLGTNSVALADGDWGDAAMQVGPHGFVVIGRTQTMQQDCSVPVTVAFTEGFTLNNDVRVITAETEDGDEIFSEMVAQGTSGVGIEMGLEAARLVFEEPYYTEHNQAFLRDDSNLAILFVSDEDDMSPYSVDDYLRYFIGLKGEDAYREPSRLRLSAVVGKDPPATPYGPSCESLAGSAAYGRRYIEAANETVGLVDSICADDFAPIVTELGLTLSGLELDFKLSEMPRLETLVVELFEDYSEESKVSDLIRDVDFTYESEGNLLHFDEEQVPPSQYYIVASYNMLSSGQTSQAADDGGAP